MRPAGRAPAEAVALRLEGWQRDNAADKEKWDQQVERDKAEAEAREKAEQERRAEEDLAEKKEFEKKRPKLPRINRELEIKHAFRPQVSAYAMAQLAAGKRVDLWYFSWAGCRDVQTSKQLLADEALAIVSSGGSLSVAPANAHRASPNAIDDHLLSWEEFSRACTRIIECMIEANWPEDYVEMFRTFFYLLGSHSFLHNERNGVKAILLYQERQRIKFHQHIASHPEAYPITKIDEEYLVSCLREIEAQEWHDRVDAMVSRFTL